jgi:ABC-type transport system substrate-binding protein
VPIEGLARATSGGWTASGFTCARAAGRRAEERFRILANGDYDIGLGGWVADNTDPTEFYDSLLSSAQVSRNGQHLTNLARSSDPETDAALAAFRVNPSPANRKVITDFIELQAMIVPPDLPRVDPDSRAQGKDFPITSSGHVTVAEVVF